MLPRTTFLSRLIGFYSIVVSLSMVVHKQATVGMVTALTHNAPVLFVVGLITVVAGLAMVLSHNVWSGGPVTVIVTLIGWITLIKGLFFLFLSPETASWLFLGEFHYEQLFYLYTAISFLLGIYLTYGGLRHQSVK